ncbi:MarR family winged helix-turn-helix transcriptional regulator [Ampullimonas aquatilis]|uniref:MarR family winged helix-turn-helix transcriptional regulator n=1 Tax=Ampullimonas aquatilis TaxID=1341549 RepID=UPI003C7678B2
MPNNTADWRPGGSPGFHLNLLSRLLTRFFDRHLADLAINVAYLPVLGALRGSTPLSQKELAQIGQIGQPAMAQMLERMLKEGLLIRTSDPTDSRKAQFTLSERATDQMASIRSALSEGNSQIFSVLTDDEIEEFMASLKKIEARLKTLLEAEK